MQKHRFVNLMAWIYATGWICAAGGQAGLQERSQVGYVSRWTGKEMTSCQWSSMGVLGYLPHVSFKNLPT